MADEAEDVLELLPEDEVSENEELDGEQELDGDLPDEDEDGELSISFEGEEAAPASENESSVIRDLRKANREQAKRLAEFERGQTPEKVEVGPEPTLESADYDEDKFKAEWTAWNANKAKAEQQDMQAQARQDEEAQQWKARQTVYEADKGRLGVSDYQDAEDEVFSALPKEHQALLLLADKPAALVYALSKSPSKLADLSKLNLAKAAMMIGKLEDKVQMSKRKLPDPDRPVQGNSAPVSADKTLARLEKEAERTGNRTEVARYKKKLNSRA